MRLVRAIAIVPALTLFTWACGQDNTGPHGISESQTKTSSGDFYYIARPPHVATTPTKVGPNAIPFCGGGFICYAPQNVREAYDFPTNLDGSGQTIVIVDAFGSPTIQSDLADFDNFFGLSAPPGGLTVVCLAGGCPPFDPTDPHDQASWSLETSLDVEYAHAMAPGAKIVLMVASTSSGNAINAAEAVAIQQYPGSIMSQSFGTPEIVVSSNNTQIQQAHKNYQAAQAAGITVLASAGDFGATNGFSTANANYPASDPLVTGVGGTEGDPYPGGLDGCGKSRCTGNYGGEQVWNEPSVVSEPVATGGAPSAFFPVPNFQNGLGLTSRTVPDVAYNAAINGGVIVFDATLGGAFIVGGTSAGSPQWAAIVALADQAKGAPLGYINPSLYAIRCSRQNYGADFHDITTGNNQLFGTPVGFNAGPGYDFATGLGTPDVAKLIQDLVTPLPACS